MQFYKMDLNDQLYFPKRIIGLTFTVITKSYLHSYISDLFKLHPV